MARMVSEDGQEFEVGRVTVRRMPRAPGGWHKADQFTVDLGDPLIQPGFYRLELDSGETHRVLLSMIRFHSRQGAWACSLGEGTLQDDLAREGDR